MEIVLSSKDFVQHFYLSNSSVLVIILITYIPEKYKNRVKSILRGSVQRLKKQVKISCIVDREQ